MSGLSHRRECFNGNFSLLTFLITAGILTCQQETAAGMSLPGEKLWSCGCSPDRYQIELTGNCVISKT